MSGELLAAVIAAAVAIAGAGITLYGQVWQFKSRRQASLTDAATALVGRYAEPLVAAAYDLQSRIHNVVAGSFLDEYHRRGDERERRYAETSTLWLLGQYLGWAETLRREVQFLDLGTVDRSRELRRRLRQVESVLGSDRKVREPRFTIFRADQRAIGEIMITERTRSDGSVRCDCLGYAEFTTKVEADDFARWFTSWREGLAATAAVPAAGPPLEGGERLVRLQWALVDLVDLLDESRTRYPAPPQKLPASWLTEEARSRLGAGEPR